MTADANRRIFERYVKAFNANDIDGWFVLLADDFRLRGKGMPDSGIDHDINRDELRKNMTKYRGLFRETIQLSIDSIVCDGDRLAAECHSHAVLATGAPYANNYSFHVRFCDGKIAEMTEYCCTYSAKTRLRDTGVGIEA
jgi:ketosteroid isomerase-like protein